MAQGKYEGEISICHTQGQSVSTNITLEVLPVRLVEPSHILGFWNFQRDYHGEIGQLDEVYQIMSRHGMNAVFSKAGIFDLP